MANIENENVTPVTNSVKSVKANSSNKTAKVKKDKPRKSLGKMFKEVISELKKVSWPSFAKVVKQTGVVITVVLVFALVLLGFDTLFSFLYKLLIKVVK